MVVLMFSQQFSATPFINKERIRNRHYFHFISTLAKSNAPFDKTHNCLPHKYKYILNSMLHLWFWQRPRGLSRRGTTTSRAHTTAMAPKPFFLFIFSILFGFTGLFFLFLFCCHIFIRILPPHLANIMLAHTWRKK